MSNVVFFKSKSELSSEQNLYDFIAHCRDNLTLYSEDEYEGKKGWDSNKWKFHAPAKTHTMTFSKYSTDQDNYSFEPMDAPFIEFSKAYIRYRQSEKQVTSIVNKLIVLRVIHDVLIDEYGVTNIGNLTGISQQEIVVLCNERYPKSPLLFRFGGQLVSLYDFLREFHILPMLPEWKNPWRREGAKAESTKVEDRKWQEERCPSQHQMLSLAQCFSQSKEPVDLYWSSVLAFLMFAPGRAGELSYLTVNSLHEEEGRLGVRWYAQKGFDHTVKWVPKPLENTEREAFSRLMKLGEPARECAKFAHEYPNTFFRHVDCVTSANFLDNEPLNAYQFAAAMGFDKQKVAAVKSANGGPDSFTAWDSLNRNSKWIQNLRVNGNPTYNDLAQYTLTKYKNADWPYIAHSERPIYESLLLIRENELHAKHSTKGHSWVLPDVNRVNDQLKSRPLKDPIRTIFQRFDLKNEDGSKIALSSHQLRVWLSTMAERGGMDAFRLAQWAGRARISDNRHYDLRTPAEKDEQVKSILAYKERPTALEAVKMNLPVSYEDVGITNRIGVVDVTEYGMCTHDYSMSPCTKGGECMTCREHICIKGMPNTLERLIELEKRLDAQFKKAQEDSGQSVFGADRWVTHFGWKLSHVKTQRMRMEDKNIAEGTILRIPDVHDPSAIERTLKSKGLDTGTPDNQKSIDMIISGLLGS